MCTAFDLDIRGITTRCRTRPGNWVRAGIFGLPASVRFTDLAGGQVQFGPSQFAPQETFQQNMEAAL